MKTLHSIPTPTFPVPRNVKNVIAYLRRPDNTYVSMTNRREGLWFRYIAGTLYFKWDREDTPPPLDDINNWMAVDPQDYAFTSEHTFNPMYLIEVA